MEYSPFLSTTTVKLLVRALHPTLEPNKRWGLRRCKQLLAVSGRCKQLLAVRTGQVQPKLRVVRTNAY